MLSTDNNRNSNSTGTPRNENATQKLIRENVDFLIEQLEAGQSDALTAYLTAMSHFHNYSFGNILQIARQKPDATRVAGLYAWNQLGRRVKKGEKGIQILAPMLGVKRKKDAEAEQDITKQNVPVLVGFRALLNLEEPKYSIEQIAAKTGKSPAYVAQRLKLTELSPAVVEAFYKDEIGVGHALLLAKLQPAEQEQQATRLAGVQDLQIYDRGHHHGRHGKRRTPPNLCRPELPGSPSEKAEAHCRCQWEGRAGKATPR